ncbi:chloride channel protein [Alcanivorax sp. HI0044]|uniref:chloride channel protein n=5 Tax=Alcanivorax TaxID=59753 RepID=UPI0009ED41D1|nr:chloride channel protein [Alcanivorax sp. HI0044]
MPSSSRTQQGVPVSPSLSSQTPDTLPVNTAASRRRLVWICVLAIGLGALAAPVAKGLIDLIHLVTNLFFYGRISLAQVEPQGHGLGAWVIVIPVIGGLIVGAMARWGANAIRGHGIPEAMEQVLLNDSRIPARITFLKPLSSAVSIGTGGPFGAEGPIIATGGALGSLLGQISHITALERKTLLAAGAAAGMAAVFSAPLSAVLLAVELLLFEFRGRSMLPVMLATIVATGCRYLLLGTEPVFAMQAVLSASSAALLFYAVMGALIGCTSVFVTRVLYWIEDGFERLPIHWMWWPALGGLAVGLIGFIVPQTLGVGYQLISDIVNAKLALSALLLIGFAKWVSWSIALGSGTSGGTLAPLFIIGGSLGAGLAILLSGVFPEWGISPAVAGLVGMAAMFAGASRALLTAVVFAVEVTHQPNALLPLMAGCASAYLCSSLLMNTTIMTEKISRRGVTVPDEYAADPLAQIRVESVFSTKVVTLNAQQTLAEVQQWLQDDAATTHHQGFPVVDSQGVLQGVVTRRDIWQLDASGEMNMADIVRRAPVVITPDKTLRDAADHMVRNGVGRVVITASEESEKVLGILTRSDIIRAHTGAISSRETRSRHIRFQRKKNQ